MNLGCSYLILIVSYAQKMDEHKSEKIKKFCFKVYFFLAKIAHKTYFMCKSITNIANVLGIYNFEGGLLPKRECHHHLHKNYLVTTENS